MLMDCVCGVGIEAKLDINRDVVVCMNCDEIVETTSFMRATMKSNHDTREVGTARIPDGGFLTTCPNPKCNRDFSAELDRKTDKVSCPLCGTEANISVISKGMLRANRVFEGSTKEFFENEGKEAHREVEQEVLDELDEVDIEVEVIKVKREDGELPTTEDLKAVRGDVESRKTPRKSSN